MTPKSEAKRLGLDYIGFTKLWKGANYAPHELLYYFTDPKTKSTIAVFDLSKLEDKMNASRKTFGE